MYRFIEAKGLKNAASVMEAAFFVFGKGKVLYCIHSMIGLNPFLMSPFVASAL